MRMRRIRSLLRAANFGKRKKERMAIRQKKPQKLDSTVYNMFAFETVFFLFARSFDNSRIKSATDLQKCTVRRSARRHAFPLAPLRRLKALRFLSAYGVKNPTTVWTALLVPFTVLCATFFAVIAVFFATCLAVRTGPASTLLKQTAKAIMVEKNAFIVIKVSLLTRRMRLLVVDNSRIKSSTTLPHSRKDRDCESISLIAWLQR